MEITQEETKEVLGILSSQNGLELDEIHDECKGIDSQKQLALILHQMNNLGLIYKINKKYFKTALDSKGNAEVSKPPVEPIVVKPEVNNKPRFHPTVDQRVKITKPVVEEKIKP